MKQIAKQFVMQNVDLFSKECFGPHRNNDSSLGVYNDGTRLQRWSIWIISKMLSILAKNDIYLLFTIWILACAVKN